MTPEESMHASGTADTEQRVRRSTPGQKKYMEIKNKRKAQENERDMLQEIMAILKAQTDILMHLADLQEKQLEG
ncbi:hypothetical protein KIL84_021223 [Mauremys mutica]|uniref:Uncharacterized protein n=1 Tax=Mauremys mutica TaxID=74926 RepID=A0A9D4B0N1_9SAUR|nr:hypothetical protein KIL84_021223 [Mauremys mutica]